MSAILPILLTLGRIFGSIIGGYILFQIPWLRKHIDVLIKIIINVLFPIYFVHSLATGWGDAVSAGWKWIVIFFVASCVMMCVQYLLGRWMAGRGGLFRTGLKRELILLVTMQNAGNIPLPIINAIAPKQIQIYLFFYFLSFNLVFWSYAIAVIGAGRDGNGPVGKIRFKINPPLVGILAGTVIAFTGVYRYVPGAVQKIFHYSGETALVAVLVMLGAILATIELKKIKVMPVFVGVSIVKMFIYPGIIFIILVFLRLRSLSPEMAEGIKTAFLLQAAAPPATNILIMTRAYGSKEQEVFVSNGIIHTYLFSVVSLPIFLILATYIF